MNKEEVYSKCSVLFLPHSVTTVVVFREANMYFNTKLISYLLYPPISFIFPVDRVTAKKWQKLGSLSASCVVVNKRQTNPKETHRTSQQVCGFHNSKEQVWDVV